ncbi:MAG: hypothetical protein ABJA83_03725 [Burkholderiaceae bacterium]
MNTNIEMTLVVEERVELSEETLDLSPIELDIVSGGTAIGCTY